MTTTRRGVHGEIVWLVEGTAFVVLRERIRETKAAVDAC